jgi:hypothetical protein
MTKSRVVLRMIELLLCIWIVGSQVWYLTQFSSLVEFATRNVFNHG